ncbi:hypothetical protein PV325_011903 [Microctonus aethiopoides]|nr:hypothetical protein PV325_011903 [Microctonus aethiopoides]
MKELEAENTRRIFRIRETCTKYNLGIYQTVKNDPVFKYPPTPQYEVFYIDQIHQISYCPIYKSGSTTWLFNMCLLMNIPEEELNSGNEQLSTIARRILPAMDFPEAEKAMTATTKLLVVRHPFERLLSAYRDKLENSVAGREHGTLHFYHKYGAAIVRKYRDRNFLPPSEDQVIRRKDVAKPAGIEPTWREFVDYLINTDLASYGDDHWMPYYLFCTPCSLNYTIVAKVETLEQDQVFAIKRMKLDDLIAPKWRHKNGLVNASRIYFRQLTRNKVYQLYNKLKLDFEMFDYSPDQYYTYASDI